MERLKMSDTVHCHGCGVEVHPLVIGETVAFFNCTTCGATFATTVDGEEYVEVPRAMVTAETERHYIGWGVDDREHYTVCASPDETVLLDMGLTVSMCSCDGATYRDCTEVNGTRQAFAR